ncbi:MAG: hypothetical protein ABIH36_00075 [bacterium]
MRTDVDELVFFDDSLVVGDTFIFEPAGSEEPLGMLLAAAETEGRDGVGRELLETMVAALQREYYRDVRRGMLASFESALHQANLVLHDITERGVRDWMGSFHLALGVLSGRTLHVSSAGNGRVLLARQRRVTSLTDNLSHSPITDPLRTFSQVASGVVSQGDVLYFGTSHMEQIFRREDLASFAVDHSAAGITLRLQQLYEDQRKRLPVAVLVATLSLEENMAMVKKTRAVVPSARREPVAVSNYLAPRRPLEINRSILRRLALLTGRILVYSGKKIGSVLWPLLLRGSRQGGRVLYKASKSAGRKAQQVSGKISLEGVQTWPQLARKNLRHWLATLPKSSKVFAVLALILAGALVISLVMMQKKRATDYQFQQASEMLHEARTKKEAADTALIYDNRDQARSLLAEAEDLTARLRDTGLYQEEVGGLKSDITTVYDRLDKVMRVQEEQLRVVGDFSDVLPGAKLSQLLWLQNNLYAYDRTNNTIVRMSQEGTTDVVSRTTQGIGFFTTATTQGADKSLVLATDSPGMALFDAKTGVLQKQEIELPSGEPEVKSLATFGNRLYLYDAAAGNIYGYSKTLRGYSGGNAWITAEDFPRDNIVDIGVDGYIYTLHQDGVVGKLLKGAPVDFTLEQVEPAISGSAKLIINENLVHLYIFDPPNRRVVIFDTMGNLNRQIYLGDGSSASGIAVDTEETALYVLDGTRVLAVSLRE